MSSDAERAESRPGWGWRTLGVAFIAMSTVPLYGLVNTSDDALRRLSLASVEGTVAFMVSAAFLALLLGVVLAFLIPVGRFRGEVERLGAAIEGVPVRAWAGAVSVLAFLLGLAANRWVFRGLFVNVDEIASSVQAQAFTVGSLGVDLPASAAHWLIPNMLVVDAGLVSQFPPSHLAFLAGTQALGMPTLVGPLLFALLAGLAALSLPQLLPDTPRAARVASLLVAVSPFMAFLGGGALSHLSAGAFLWAALYAALRARDGGAGWAVLAGASIGVAVCSRPWIGVLLGTVATLGIWLPELRGRGRGTSWLVRRSLGTVLGGAPCAAALGAYNSALFGGPTRLGYLAAFGERHKLGFHADPWGNFYTLRDAIGLTSADMISFGEQLLETPIPVGLVIGLWLLLAARELPRGTAFLAVWATVPIAGNFLYWFHSTHVVRMMYEGAPAWLALCALALSPLMRASLREPAEGPSRLDAASVGVWTVMICGLLAVGVGVPDRAATYIWEDDGRGTDSAPSDPDGSPSIVFVHTSWNERISALLQGEGGMRQDTVISALRRNTNCDLHTYALAREVPGQAVLPALDLRQVPGSPQDVVRREMEDGSYLRTREGEELTPACLRQFQADRFGSVALASLLWQGEVPGVERGLPMFVRDLGPERNLELRSVYADRRAWVYVPTRPGGPPELVPYDEAMEVLWGAAAGTAVPAAPGI